MSLQLTLTVFLVFGAVLYLLRVAWNTWKAAKTGCGGGGCHCKNADPAAASIRLIPSESLILRQTGRRKS
jgi:hypothetical protein